MSRLPSKFASTDKIAQALPRKYSRLGFACVSSANLPRSLVNFISQLLNRKWDKARTPSTAKIHAPRPRPCEFILRQTWLDELFLARLPFQLRFDERKMTTSVGTQGRLMEFAPSRRGNSDQWNIFN